MTADFTLFRLPSPIISRRSPLRRSTLLLGRLGIELLFGVFDEFLCLLGEAIHPAPDPGEHQERDHRRREEHNAEREYGPYQDILLPEFPAFQA
jgi:hypothetical protein